jgi:hypothetical protein
VGAGSFHGDVDILEDGTLCDAACAVGRLYEIIPGIAAMLASEDIHEGQGLGELFCLDQKSSAINVPFRRRIPQMVPPLGEGGLSFSVIKFLIVRLPVTAFSRLEFS